MSAGIPIKIIANNNAENIFSPILSSPFRMFGTALAFIALTTIKKSRYKQTGEVLLHSFVIVS